MKKFLLGKTGMEVSAITYGGIVSMRDGQENSDKYVEYAIKNGINYFDVAPTYEDAQEKLGNSLIPYRKDVHLACKTRARDAEETKRLIEESFKLLHTDYFDVYQMHELESVEAVERAFSKGGAMEPILKGKEEGYFKNLGITCHSEDAALRALELYDFDTVLFPTNWGLSMAKGFGNRLAEAKKEKNFGLLGMKSMIHRSWESTEEQMSSRFPKSWCKPIFDNDEFLIAAIKYARSMGVDTIVPPGTFECFKFAVEHVDEILTPLTEKEMELLKSELKGIEGKYFF